jgi:hypothetical protein
MAGYVKPVDDVVLLSAADASAWVSVFRDCSCEASSEECDENGSADFDMIRCSS